MSKPSTYTRPAGVLPLIICHLLIAVPLAFYLNIWSDEASTLYSTQNGIAAALQNAATVERQAPLYFWLMSLWRSIDGSIFFARLFSIICSIASIRLFAGFAYRVFRPRTALLTAAFFALHPIMIWASVEIRVYALVILLSVALIAVFFRGFFEEQDDVPTLGGTRIGFLLLAIVTLYTNYYLGFLLGSFFVALLVTKRWRPARDYFGIMIGTGLAFAPLIWTIRSQFQVNTSGFHEERTLVEGVRRLWDHSLTFILPADVVPGEETSPAGIARLWVVRAAVLFVGFFAIRRRDRISGKTVAFGVIVSAIVICLLVAYFLLGGWLVSLRHASVLFVPLILFGASLLNDLFVPETKRGPAGIARVAAPVLGLVVLASFSYALLNLYPNMAKRGDWARVGEYIQQNENPNQPIIIFHTYDAMALPYHYHGVNQIFPNDRFFDYDFVSPEGNDEHMTVRTDFTISQIPQDAPMIWLIVNDECIVTPGLCTQLENFVQANYNVVDERTFYRQTVTLLARKAQ